MIHYYQYSEIKIFQNSGKALTEGEQKGLRGLLVSLFPEKKIKLETTPFDAKLKQIFEINNNIDGEHILLHS